MLSIEVTSDRTVRCIHVQEPSGMRAFDDVAVRALAASTYAPAEFDGRAVDSVLRYTYRFKLVE